MKMLKKAAAVVMAAAMSLTLLTACGGGSGTGSAVGESYTMETTLIEENGEEPKKTQKEYETTNGTWFYIENTYGAERTASLENIKTGERYKINPVSMKAYKVTASGNAGGDGADQKYTTTTTMGTWQDKDGKIYTTETITVTESDGKAVTTYYYYQDKPEYIKYESTSKYGDYEEVYKVTRYTKTADESKFDVSKYTLVENRDDLWN